MKETSTQKLLELMKSSTNYHDYLKENSSEIAKTHMKLDRALASLLVDKGVKKADVIARSGIENHYAYQIFSGVKVPTRDKVVMLSIGLCLTVDETINLLKITGYAPLYGKNQRDNAILFGISKGLTILEINDILYELDLELLV